MMDNQKMAGPHHAGQMPISQLTVLRQSEAFRTVSQKTLLRRLLRST